MKRLIGYALLALLLAGCSTLSDQYPENILEWHKDKKSPGAIVLHRDPRVGDWAEWQRRVMVRMGQYQVADVLRREVFAPKKDGLWRIVSTGDLEPIEGIPGSFYTRYHVDDRGEVKAAFLGFNNEDFQKESPIEVFPALSEEIESNANRFPADFDQNPMLKTKAMEIGRLQGGNRVLVRTKLGDVATRVYVTTDDRTDPEEGFEEPLYFHWMFFISDDVPFQLVARIHFLSREPAAQAGPNLEVMELIRAERGP